MAGAAFAMTGLFVFLALAGCSGGKDDAVPGEGASSVVSASGDASNAGNIQGIVTDDTLAPIPGAQVAILSENLFAATSEDGSFAFQNLAPGTYHVAAAALGFSSVAKAVDVVALETSTVSLVLAPVPLAAEAWVETLGPLPGFANCVFGTPVVAGVCPGASALDNEKSSFRYDDHPNQTVSIVGEFRWQQTSAGTSRLMGMTFSYVGRPNTHWWCFGSGTSPVKWQYVYDGNDCVTTGRSTQQGASSKPKEEQELLSFVSIPFTSVSAEDPFPAHLALQQPFEAIFTLFQNETPPEDYTAFPDS